MLVLQPFGPTTWIFDFAEHVRLDIRIFHPGQTVLKEGEYGEMTYILVHGEASCLVSVSVWDFGPIFWSCLFATLETALQTFV